MKGYGIPFYRLYTTSAIINSQLKLPGPIEDWPYQQEVEEGGGVHGALPATSELLATDRLWGEGTIVFNCVPTAEPTRLQMDSSKAMIIETPCLISVGH